MRQRTLLIGLLVLSALPRLAFGQAKPPPAPPPRQEGSAEFAFVGTTGNSSTQTIGVGAELIYRPSPWESKVKVIYVRNEAEDELKAQALVLTARAQRPIRSRLSGYSQYGYQRDRFAGILDRNAVEGGVSYAWLAGPPHKLMVDAAVGYANEHRLLGPDLSTAIVGAGGNYVVKISDNSEFSEDARIVVSVPEGSDWRYVNAAALTAKVSTKFSLKVTNSVRYVNLPVAGFKSTDVITAVALVAKF